MEKIIKTDNIKIGVIKEYTDKGLVLASDYEYVILTKEDNKYFDIFDRKKEEKFAVFQRMPYSNMTKDGEAYGTKVCQVNGVAPKDGSECVVLLNVDFKDVFAREEILMRDLKDFALKSKYFIRQRREYAFDRLIDLENPISMLKVIVKDTLDEKRIAKQKKKCR